MTKEEQLFYDNINLVHFVITNKCHINLSSSLYEELYQQGCLGLWKACKTHNGSTEFSTYGMHCIFNEIRMLNRLESRKIKKYNVTICSLENEITDKITFKDLLCSDENSYVKELNNKIMIEEILNIDFKYKDLIVDYYLNNITQDELAKKYNICRQAISKKIRIGIEDLKEKLKVGDNNGEKENKNSENNKTSSRC